ncbi:MAG: hypothetical protein MNSN_02080 [Minisyncoccus archaeiphilus]|nr:MAG: hypothetical protein MNSN_02080 [Candidatus Parcubacteria bacterium]
MMAKILFRKRNGIKEEVYYSSLRKATKAFRKLCKYYPGVAWTRDLSGCAQRMAVSRKVWKKSSKPHRNPELGDKMLLYYRDDRREGWYYPMSVNCKRFYRGSFTEDICTFPGHVYMWLEEAIQEGLIPSETVRLQCWMNVDSKSIRVEEYAIEKSEFNRVFQETGNIPTHGVVIDNSGDLLYLKKIVWGNDPKITKYGH